MNITVYWNVKRGGNGITYCTRESSPSEHAIAQCDIDHLTTRVDLEYSCTFPTKTGYLTQYESNLASMIPYVLRVTTYSSRLTLLLITTNRWHETNQPTIQRIDLVTAKPRHLRRRGCKPLYDARASPSVVICNILEICTSAWEHSNVNTKAKKKTVFSNKRLLVELLRALLPLILTSSAENRHSDPVKHHVIPMKKYRLVSFAFENEYWATNSPGEMFAMLPAS